MVIGSPQNTPFRLLIGVTDSPTSLPNTKRSSNIITYIVAPCIRCLAYKNAQHELRCIFLGQEIVGSLFLKATRVKPCRPRLLLSNVSTTDSFILHGDWKYRGLSNHQAKPLWKSDTEGANNPFNQAGPKSAAVPRGRLR